ncbi:MAG TPA: hypothetical protein VHB45_06390 [Alloacidobacterium sp.]|nr:hypothetical protein [Alloacidobacterium sp.]
MPTFQTESMRSVQSMILLAERFEIRQIGAAFRSGTSTVANVRDASDMGEIGSNAVHSAMDSDTVGSGPASDTRTVTPAGLSPGSGSVIQGAGRPGPIPGSEIPRRHDSGTNDTKPAEKSSAGNGQFS